MLFLKNQTLPLSASPLTPRNHTSISLTFILPHLLYFHHLKNMKGGNQWYKGKQMKVGWQLINTDAGCWAHGDLLQHFISLQLCAHVCFQFNMLEYITALLFLFKLYQGHFSFFFFFNVNFEVIIYNSKINLFSIFFQVSSV